MQTRAQDRRDSDSSSDRPNSFRLASRVLEVELHGLEYSVVTFLATGTVLATNRSPARKCRMICMNFFLSVRSILCAPLSRVSKAEVEILSQERANTSSKCRIVANQVYDL